MNGAFGAVREEVVELMQSGESFSDAEATIDAAPLPEDQRAALWLVAWSLDDRRGAPPAVPVALD